uniref:Craniofacial development protein 1 n=1 Tax=Periophthalmus magnuspinnatus TaxID=409849 RepID=A0A3B4BAT0_9GOBI
MNYSDYDSDGYSSNEDADYVPSDGSLSEDDINECEKEDPLHEDEEVPHPGSVHKSKKKKKDKNLSRKRKKGIFKVENADKDQVEETNQPPNEEPPAQLQQEEDEAKQKKKSDDLWASFLFDVGSRPKLSTAATDSDTTSKAETKPSEPEKVTITKVFDFAGEEVRVNKEVAADSQEARRFLKSQSSPQENKETEEEFTYVLFFFSGVKRPAGLSKIIGRIGGKKQKMSTLEKSKMDWDAFKSEEGISEELAIHNRGREGYVERKNFLERVDHRQFEIEKTVRLSNMKR